MTVMSLTYQAMLVALKLAAPLLFTVLTIGLVISILQAATQVNEMTLAFVPKVLGAATVVVLLGPWFISTMVDFIQGLISLIPELVQ